MNRTSGGKLMGQEDRVDSSIGAEPEIQPLQNSYDSGYEHSWQHWAAVRQLVEEAE